MAVLMITFLAPLVAKFALKFGAPEFFALMVLGLSLVTGLAGNSVLRALMSASVGMIVAIPGIDPVLGHVVHL